LNQSIKSKLLWLIERCGASLRGAGPADLMLKHYRNLTSTHRINFLRKPIFKEPIL